MSDEKIFIFVAIDQGEYLSSVVSVDSRALRKRRQFSSASYYIAGFNPYANPNVDPASLTYPSGPFYDPPKYVHSETLYGGNGNTNSYSASSLYNQVNPMSETRLALGVDFPFSLSLSLSSL